MKYPCELIQDLIPLYIDGICSDESKKIVEEHLSLCKSCNEYYNSINNMKDIPIDSIKKEYDQKKAKSFQKLKKKLFHKQILMIIISISLLLITGWFTMNGLKKDIEKVNYSDSISVSMIDGSLITRLQSSRIHQAEIKRVNLNEKEYLFYYLENSKWDELTTGDEVYSELMLCPENKNAQDIDRIYYYTGNYEGLESMNTKELQNIIKDSTLVWKK